MVQEFEREVSGVKDYEYSMFRYYDETLEYFNKVKEYYYIGKNSPFDAKIYQSFFKERRIKFLIQEFRSYDFKFFFDYFSEFRNSPYKMEVAIVDGKTYYRLFEDGVIILSLERNVYISEEGIKTLCDFTEKNIL